MDIQLEKDLLLKIFARADKILQQKEVSGEILLFGGSALIFSFSERVFTEDLDAYLVPKEVVLEALSEAAFQEGIITQVSKWVSTAVLKYVYARPPQETEIVFEGENLKVFVPTKEYLLALKIFAAREEKDFHDALLLAKHLGLETEKDLEEIFAKVFPRSYLDEKRKYFVKILAQELKKHGS